MGRAAERGRRRCLTARCAAGTRGGLGWMRKLKPCSQTRVSLRVVASRTEIGFLS